MLKTLPRLRPTRTRLTRNTRSNTRNKTKLPPRIKSNHTQKLRTNTSVSDFFKNYTLLTYSNDKPSRELIGINHPAMQDISVNDYMNAFDNAISNLRSYVYKSKTERENDIRESMYIQKQIKRIINGPNTESTTIYSPRKTKKTPLRRHSIGGATGAVHNIDSDDDDISREFLQQPAGGITLKDRLTFHKLMHFIELASKTHDSSSGWRHRATTFMKYMFFNIDEFDCNVEGNKLTGRFNSDMVTNYEFNIATSTYLPEPNPSQSRYIAQAPPLLFTLGSIPEATTWIKLAEVAPILNIRSHTTVSTLPVNVSMFKGIFDKMSNVQRRHYIYSIILFVIIHATEPELQILINDFNRIREDTSSHLHLEAVIEITQEIKRHFRLELPYSMFFNRATVKENKVTPTDINMIFLNSIIRMERATVLKPGKYYDDDSLSTIKQFMLPCGYSNIYFEMLKHIYIKIFQSYDVASVQPFEFDVTNTHLIQQAEQQERHPRKIEITNIDFQGNPEFAFYFTLKNTDNVVYVPQPHQPIFNIENVGIIQDDNQNAFFYRGINSSTIGFIPNSSSRNIYITEPDIMQKLPLSREVWTTQSRIPTIRDKMMGYLSHLVYYPNDTIEHVSSKFFNKIVKENGNRFIYVGPFDRDPSYPLSTTGEVTYSRVHVWLKIIPSSGGELYFISRGSKTGYDWDSSDSDIQNGVLNSQRSLNMMNVLREVIEYLNACLHPDSTVGSRELQTNLSALIGKSIQIYSSGHSLGGYLSLSIAHSAFCVNLLNGFSFPYICGITHAHNRRKDVVSLNSYIIPIVFDPYVASPPIMNAFSFLPYARIHSCIDSNFNVDPPMEDRFYTLHRFFTIRQTNRMRYDDAASAYFLAYLRNKHSIKKFYDTMGKFSIFHYKNVYNLFENFVYHDIYYLGGPVKRYIYDTRTSHNILNIIGLAPEYIFSHMFQTEFKIDTPIGQEQSLQAAHYTFPVPNDKRIIPSVASYRGITSLGQQRKYISYTIENVFSSHLSSSCVSKISYQSNMHPYTVTTIEPQSNEKFSFECKSIFLTDIENFINSPF
jgi:hypothetical protein